MINNPLLTRTAQDFARFGSARTYGTPRHPNGHTLKTIGLTTRDLDDLRRE